MTGEKKPKSSFDKINIDNIPAKIKFRIENFVQEYIPAKVIDVRDEKILHDAIHGTHRLKKHEVALIDLPLIQRLRQIRQTGFTYFTFPSATHSRFEHTIGVLILTEKLGRAINRAQESYFADLKDLRIAALMHDCGHGPFSHSSEEMYRYFDDMQELIGPKGEFKGASPHEALSCLVVLSQPFKDYFTSLIEKHDIDCDYNNIANYIVGRASKTHFYAAQVINGPFDADKLDYIFRDGKFTGLPLLIDYDRLWYAARVGTVNDWRRLTVEFNGVTPIEEILFSKMVLFSTIYHHHKVRACDCMLKGIFEFLLEHNEEITVAGKKIEYATDFLWLTDEEIFALACDERFRGKEIGKVLHTLIHNLQYRRLLKRALVISRDTVDCSDGDFLGLTKLGDSVKEGKQALRDLAKKIWKASGEPCLKEELWIDLPKLPSNFEVDNIFVHSEFSGKQQYRKIREFFRMDTWAQQYALYKWKGYVFCPDYCVEKVSKVAQDVVEKEYSVKLKKSAVQSCHIKEKEV